MRVLENFELAHVGGGEMEGDIASAYGASGYGGIGSGTELALSPEAAKLACTIIGLVSGLGATCKDLVDKQQMEQRVRDFNVCMASGGSLATCGADPRGAAGTTTGGFDNSDNRA